MSIGRIKETEIDAEKITVTDVANICYEVAKHSKSAHALLNRKKLKDKYAIYGKMVGIEHERKYGKEFVDNYMGQSLMKAEIDHIIKKGTSEQLNTVLKKYDVEKLISLGSKLEIKRDMVGSKTYYNIRETEGKGRVNPLISMYNKIKEDAQEKLKNRSQIRKEERHAKEIEELADRLNKKEQQRKVEVNIRKGRDDYYQGMERAEKMDKFRTELEGGVQEWNREAIEKYGDVPGGRAWKEMQKNPYQKKLDEIDSDSKSR